MASKGKSKTPKIDPALLPALELERAEVQRMLTESERAALVKLAPETAFVMAPTTLCTPHVPNEERPLECAKCGKPISFEVTPSLNRTAELEARQSELRFEPESLPIDDMIDDGIIRVEGPRQLTPEEVSAAYMGSTFDSFLEAEGIKDEVDSRARAAVDDGPLPFDDEDAHLAGLRASDHPRIKPLVSRTLVLDPVAVDIKRLWYDRLANMAKADGFTDSEFVEQLIKRQWIASGAGKGKR